MSKNNEETSYIVEGIWAVTVAVCAVLFFALKWLGVCQMYAGVAVALIAALVYAYGNHPLRGLTDIPGPPGEKQFIGHLDSMLLGKDKFFWIWIDDYVKKYNRKLFKIYFGRQPTIVVSDLDQIKEVFVTQFTESFHSRPSIPGAFDDNNLFTQVGEDWRSSRRALAPSFNTKNLTYFAEAMNIAALELVERLQGLSPGEEIDIYRYYGAMALQVISATSFGRYLKQGDSAHDKLIESLRMVVSPEGGGSKDQFYIQGAFPWIVRYLSKLPIPSLMKLNKAIDYINSTTADMADQLKEGKSFGDSDRAWKSFLGLLINAKDKETGKTLEQSEIKGQSLLFIFAGYETTASTLSYFTYEVARNPDIQEKIQAEIDNATRGLDQVTYKDLGKLDYLGWVLQEALRLYPIATILQREVQQDTSIAGYDLPAGSGVIVPTWSVHRDPGQYSKPNEFIPERWDPESDEQKKRHSMAWQPFGEGPRKCIGYRFALQEMKIVVANVLKSYSFTLSDKRTKHTESVETGIIPKYVYVVPKRRENVSE